MADLEERLDIFTNLSSYGSLTKSVKEKEEN
jgi:hypothetical protein